MEPLPLSIHHDPHARRAFTMHDRVWEKNRYVYPVVSRRSKGISIGINLNPDKICNFDCIYCSVDRTIPGAAQNVDLAILRSELQTMLSVACSGAIYQYDPFDKIPPALRRINDIAFSGDGEPTTCPQFPEVCHLAADLKQQANLPNVKLVLISNATMFHRPAVRAALAMMDQNNGEIWAKLDAGTQEYYELVDRTTIPLKRVIENITWAAGARPVVIQSLFMNIHGVGPSAMEIAAYAERLREIQTGGGKIKLVQVYTVARGTTEDYATALSPEELELIAGKVREAFPGMTAEVYP